MAENMKQVVRINVASLFADPAAWLEKPENKDVKDVACGNIIGIVDRINTRSSQDGTSTSRGLAGDFVTQPTAEGVEPVRSNACWLPRPVMVEMVAILENPDKTKNMKTPIVVAFAVGFARAENDDGYTWRVRPLIQPATLETPDRLMTEVAKIEKAIGADAVAKSVSTGAAPAKQSTRKK